MGAWVAPAAAAAFAAGIWLGRGISQPPAVSWACMAVGLGALVAAVALARPPPRGDPAGLVRAGLLPPADPPGPRDTVLAAARGAGSPRAASAAPAARRAAPTARRPRAAVGAAALALLLLGTGWTGLRTPSPAHSVLASLAGRAVEADAVLAFDARPGAFGWSAPVSVARVAAGDADVRVTERAWLQGRGRAPPLQLGDRVRVRAFVDEPPEGGFGDYLAGRGIVAILRARDVRALGPSANPLVRAANAARETLRRGVDRVLGGRDGGLLLGLSIGDTSRLDPGIEEDFRASGLGHLLAVSGSNVASFLAPLYGLALLLRLSARGRFVVGMVALGFFAVLTRAEPSVLRASAMAGLALLALLLGRPRAAPALLGSAVLLLLAWDPALLRSVGFQLSVAATAGILAFAGPIARRLPLPRVLGAAVGATLGAQLAVTPLLLYHFRVAPTAGIPANVLAFPAVSPALLFGVTAGGIGSVSPALARPVAAVARLPLGYLIGVADRTAAAPLPTVTSRGGLVPAVAGMALVAWLAWRTRSRPGSRRRPSRWVPAALVLALVVWVAGARAGPPGALEVRFFDVGQGDAALVRSPAGATVLVDAGPDPEDVAVELSALGVHRLDVVVASHAHADHLAGFPTVLARFQVGLVLEPGCPAESPAYRDFRRAVRDERLAVRHPRAGEVIVAADLRLEFLGPDACFTGTSSDANNDSLVFRLSRGAASVLFPGDAEEPAQQEILEDDADRIDAAILKVPHHGGGTSLPEFLVDIGASVAVVSVGQPNDYGHPVPSVIATLRAAGAAVYRTDHAGDVVVTFGWEGPLVESVPSR